MERFIPSAAIGLFLLAGPCLGGAAASGSGTMTASQCVASMKNLQLQTAALSRQLQSCKSNAVCAPVGVKLNRVTQQLASIKRKCSPILPTGSPAPSRVKKPASAPSDAGGEVDTFSQTSAIPTIKPEAIPADDGEPAGSGPGAWSGVLSRMSAAGRTVVGLGTGLAGDVFGLVKDVPIGLAKDLFSAGRNLFKGNFKEAAKDAGGAVVNAVTRTAGGVVDGLALIVHSGVDLVDTTLFGKAMPRKLTAQEKDLLYSVYKDSLDYDAIRIRDGGSSHMVMPSHVINNNIYFKELGPLYNSDGTLTWDGQTFVHEAGHVWQYQHGGGDYLHKAFFANAKYAITEGDRNKAYEWKDLAAKGVPFPGLNPEQQATVIDNLAADDRRPQGRKYLTDPETEYAREAMKLVWAGRGAP